MRRYSLAGEFLGSLPLPEPFLASADKTTGVRPNLAFESAGVPPDGRRSLVLVSDNNFAARQFTQFLLFAID